MASPRSGKRAVLWLGQKSCKCHLHPGAMGLVGSFPLLQFGVCSIALSTETASLVHMAS